MRHCSWWIIYIVVRYLHGIQNQIEICATVVAKANGDVPDDEDCGDEEEGADEEEPPARPTLSARDAMSSVKDLLDFARVANDAAMIDAATSLENIVEMHCVKQALPLQGKPPCSSSSSASWLGVSYSHPAYSIQYSTRVCSHVCITLWINTVAFSHIFSCVRFMSHCIQYCHWMLCFILLCMCCGMYAVWCVFLIWHNGA